VYLASIQPGDLVHSNIYAHDGSTGWCVVVKVEIDTLTLDNGQSSRVVRAELLRLSDQKWYRFGMINKEFYKLKAWKFYRDGEQLT
jgi:hypothetical protein